MPRKGEYGEVYVFQSVAGYDESDIKVAVFGH